jgi:formylglycine-generating enzyme required for sulfatase activity
MRGAAAVLLFGALLLRLDTPRLQSAPIPPELVTRVDSTEHRGYVETIPGTKVRFEMKAIPGGVFFMGGRAAEGGGPEERPLHPVRIRPFWMGKCEVTWDEYDLFTRRPMKTDKAANPDDPDAVTGPSEPYIDETWGYGRAGFPVIGITHHAAMQYCLWLSRKTGKTYRLPTEAEWEWAARAGTTTAYFFADSADTLGEYAWHEKDSAEVSHPVGKKKPNPWGLHDIYGNAAEWCVDLYQKDYYGSLPLGRQTLAPVVLPDNRHFGHVVRGGSWADPPEVCRSAARRRSERSWQRGDPARPPSIWWLCNGDFVGFRLVRAVEEQPELRGLHSRIRPHDLDGWRKK